MDYEDPGWRHILKRLAFTLIPFVGLWFARRQEQRSDALTGFRVIYISLVISLWLFVVVLLFIVPSDSWFATDQARWVPAAVVGAGVFSLGYVQRIRSRPLDTSGPRELAASYRANFFIGVGISEFPALAALVGTFLMGAGWIYLVGLLFSMIDMVLIGPYEREIARRQEQINAQGSSLSLGSALMQGP
jgi:hypothetical protein